MRSLPANNKRVGPRCEMGWSHVGVKDAICITLDWYVCSCISDVIQIYYDGVPVLLSDWLSLSKIQMYTTCRIGFSQYGRCRFGLG
jgi:hypothetical protein